jgi:hypothetical protein
MTQPKQFGHDQNNLYLSKAIWTVKISPEMSNLNLTKMTQPKQFGLDQNNLDMTKTIWT